MRAIFLVFPLFLSLLGGCARQGTWGAGSTCNTLYNNQGEIASLERRVEELGNRKTVANKTQREAEIARLRKRIESIQADNRRFQSGCRPDDFGAPKGKERRDSDPAGAEMSRRGWMR